MLYDFGTAVSGEGIYSGLYEVFTDYKFKGTGVFLDIYTAPTDLLEPDEDGKMFPKRRLLQFSEATQAVADLKDWHFHDGIYIPNHDSFSDILKNRDYDLLQSWFLPPSIILYANANDFSLFNLRNTGAFAGSFEEYFDQQNSDNRQHLYWSLDACAYHRTGIKYANFGRHSGGIGCCAGDNEWSRFSSRPIRAVQRHLEI